MTDIATPLQHALRGLLFADHMAGAARIIAPGDELLLTAGEASQFARAVPKVRRAAGAARFVARQLCSELGLGRPEILRGPQGEPLWPSGTIGSMSHDAVAAAAIVTATPGLRWSAATILASTSQRLEHMRVITHV